MTTPDIREDMARALRAAAFAIESGRPDLGLKDVVEVVESAILEALALMPREKQDAVVASTPGGQTPAVDLRGAP